MLRVSVTTVQVDAVVTDGNGKQVKDLGPDDFEILQDGRRQSIATFSYVATAGADPTESSALDTMPPAPAAPPPGVTPIPVAASPPPEARDPGRTFVVVVDDLSLAPESIVRARAALLDLIDRKFTATDRVAIVRTAGGTSQSQQFTSDKAVLRQEVNSLRVNAHHFERDDAQTMMERERLRSLALPQAAIPQRTNEEIDKFRGTDLNDAEQRHGNRGGGGAVIGALQTLVAGLRSVPGRKGIVLLTDGFSIAKPNGETDPVIQLALNRLADQATRARAVIYAVTLRQVRMDERRLVELW